MVEAFEIWAPREVKRLQQEAEKLQGALDLYLAAQGGMRRPKPANGPTVNDGQGKRSKHEHLFARWAAASRERPLTYPEMESLAEEEGVTLTRTQTRTIVHTQKQLGRVRPEGDGYVWKGEHIEVASPDQGEAT